MIGVDVNATADTLTEIMNWFQSGNNVAVSRCDKFMNQIVFIVMDRNDETPRILSE